VSDAELSELRDAVLGSPAVRVVGAGTQADVGDPVSGATVIVRAPSGIVAYEPADMTVTVRAGTSVAELSAALAERGQECPLDPRFDAATVGGVLACGLSGLRRLRTGPVRDRVLEVHVVTGDGRVVRGGGPTVKNVTGYDLPRLMVGTLGTLGVLGQVTLRTQPIPPASAWATSADPPAALRARQFRPSCLAWDGTTTWVLLEGHPDDLDAEIAAAGLTRGTEPEWPSGLHRGRISVAPGALAALAERLAYSDCSWLAEGGIGTVHVAASTEAGLASARAAAGAEGGWLLRESGAPGLSGFGVALPNGEVQARLKAAFDPDDRLNPGRIPYARSAA
jgi:glycolate oxidase FAD binding subunit